MSYFSERKVIRYPLKKYLKRHNLSEFGEIDDHFEKIGIKYIEQKGKFNFSCTYNYDKNEIVYYLDYVLQLGIGYSDYGICEYLSDKLKEKYTPMFENILGKIEPNNFRICKYCYYNGVDEPDYYDVISLNDEEEENE